MNAPVSMCYSSPSLVQHPPDHIGTPAHQITLLQQHLRSVTAHPPDHIVTPAHQIKLLQQHLRSGTAHPQIKLSVTKIVASNVFRYLDL